MGYPATVIPEKIFFKIGEVCDLVGVQAHVLRYWETEFPMLSPQKNRSGQRTYRRRDVEIAMRIKELLYDELYTIAGAKKKLQSELREASRLKIVPPVEHRDSYIQPVHAPEPAAEDFAEAEDDFENDFGNEIEETSVGFAPAEDRVVLDSERREALKSLAAQLLELREMLKASQAEDTRSPLRKY
jgi:DNA-binding transcriptional MerR regulator